MRGKIAFIGTHGVGKTVLTFELASYLRKRSVDADVAYENSRRCPFPINEGTTLEAQMWILANQWKEELEASRRSHLVICDRSVLDNYAYMVLASGRQEYLQPLLARWIETYDILVQVPIIDRRIVADGTRTTAREFQMRIDRMVRDLVVEFGCGEKTIELPLDRDRHLAVLACCLQERGFLRAPQPVTSGQ
ncbi:MAG: AAA family ATPase [Planctomycetes bacterium]|nr:AAA family ATPase [Planctomycetota bacterium]